MEPHGRGNNSYIGLGDQDVVRAIRLAKERFSVDEDRVYLVGDSMGGWGTWNVATRHPDLFAAIAPVFGGADYHSQYSEEALAKLTPLDRFLAEKRESSWAMAEGLLNLPILVHHGDVDRSVNVDFSRYGVRLLERWGYNIRYVELPGYGHEDLNVMSGLIDWFLEHRRVANPPRVRLRSAELGNASAYWVRVDQAASPREFMVVDAEITGPNAIRVDSQNVLALSLSPVIDTSQPVRVVWNGEPRTVAADHGRLALTAPGYQAAAGEKNAAVAGPLGEIYNTPFAIVTGTASADPAMKEMCRRKAEAAVNFWQQWQRQPPRVFLDSEISDADAARYSLLLIGGPGASRVARKVGLVEMAPDHVTIRGRFFAATDARVGSGKEAAPDGHVVGGHLDQADLAGDATRPGAADEEERVAGGVRVGNLRIQEHARRLALPLLPEIDGRLGLAAAHLLHGRIGRSGARDDGERRIVDLAERAGDGGVLFAGGCLVAGRGQGQAPVIRGDGARLAVPDHPDGLGGIDDRRERERQDVLGIDADGVRAGDLGIHHHKLPWAGGLVHADPVGRRVP